MNKKQLKDSLLAYVRSLVPEEKPMPDRKDYLPIAPNISVAWQDETIQALAWNACRAEILKRIKGE